MTHTSFVISLIKEACDVPWDSMDPLMLNNLIHQIMQADSEDIVSIALEMPMDFQVKFDSLAVITWRLAGLEGGEAIRQRAIETIEFLVDVDESERAASFLRKSAQ